MISNNAEGAGDVALSLENIWDEVKRIKRDTLIEAAAESERNLENEGKLQSLQLGLNQIQSALEAAPSREDIGKESRKLRSEMSREISDQVRSFTWLDLHGSL